MERFKCLGINDDKDFCMCCGKTELKSVVWIEDTETGEIKHFGTTCAMKPSKGFSVDSEVKQAKRDWAWKLQCRYRKARNIYKAAGGTWNQIKEYAWEAADKALYGECLAKATK